MIVAATKSGNIFGIETGKGKVVWAIKLGAKSGDLKMKVQYTLFQAVERLTH